MSNAKIIVVIFLIVITAMGCTKKKVYPVDPAIMKRFYYKPGSYWVYLDTVSGTYDSFSVTNTTKTDDNEGTKNEIHQKIAIEIRNQTNSDIVMSVSLSQTVGFGFGINNKVSTGTGPLTYPLMNNSNGSSTVNFFSLYSVNGITYPNTLFVDDNLDIGNYYINDSAGIIKCVLFDVNNSINKAWELVRFKIVL